MSNEFKWRICQAADSGWKGRNKECVWVCVCFLAYFRAHYKLCYMKGILTFGANGNLRGFFFWSQAPKQFMNKHTLRFFFFLPLQFLKAGSIDDVKVAAWFPMPRAWLYGSVQQKRVYLDERRVSWYMVEAVLIYLALVSIDGWTAGWTDRSTSSQIVWLYLNFYEWPWLNEDVFNICIKIHWIQTFC